MYINPNNKDGLVCTKDITNKYKLVCIFNSKCGACIENLINIDKIFQFYTHMPDLHIFYLAKNYGFNREELKFILTQLDNPFNFPIYIDTSMVFYKNNKNLYSIPENVVVLLDSQNRVIIGGSINEHSNVFERIDKYLLKLR